MRRVVALAFLTLALSGCSYADLGEPLPTPIFGAPVPSTAELIAADPNERGRWYLPHAGVPSLADWYKETLGPARTWSLF